MRSPFVYLCVCSIRMHQYMPKVFFVLALVTRVKSMSSPKIPFNQIRLHHFDFFLGLLRRA